MKEENIINAIETRKLIAYYSEELKRLRQILTEIKAIVEKAQWDYRMPKEVWDLILQKISECEANNG